MFIYWNVLVVLKLKVFEVIQVALFMFHSLEVLYGAVIREK